jgi:Icc-related predicted phosphoesterase
MRILFTSDIHGETKAFRRFAELLRNDDYNIGCISGDLMPYTESPLEVEHRYKKILSSVHKHILFVMGNDDGIIDSDWESEGFIQNVHNRRLNIGGYNYVGYQFTNPFIGGRFEKQESEQENDFKELKQLIDKSTILITHGPAYGILDKIGTGESVGSKALLNLVNETKPRMHLFGHIHDSFGMVGNSINGSYPLIEKFIDIDIERNMVQYID